MHPRLALASLLLTASSCFAGVVVEINGTPYSATGGPVTFGTGSTPDITITFTAQVTGTVNIRIYDSVTNDGLVGFSQNAALPQSGMGRLTLVGSASATARVNVLIADEDQSGFPGNTTELAGLQPGLTTLGGALTTGASSVGGYAHDYDAAPWATSNSTPSYGGPVFADWGNADLKGIIIPDPSLRRQTVLAAVVAGDICPDTNGAGTKGRIEVGQVLRLEARRTDTTGAIIGGDINADVVAVARDDYLTYSLCSPPNPAGPLRTGFRAIEEVRAGNAIRGCVLAQGRERDDNGALYERTPDITRYFPNNTELNVWREPPPCGWTAQNFHPEYYPLWIQRGSIFNIRVGPGMEAAGLTGEVESRLGRIYSVRSTGPIIASQIKAADGVLEVRIHNWGVAGAANQVALAKPLAVGTISAAQTDADGQSTVQKLGNDAGDDYETTVVKARNQGAVYLVETKGEFSGSVECENLIDPGDDARRDSLGRAGVIVWDGLAVRPVSGPPPSRVSLTVNHLAHNVSVFAPEFGDVVIGWQFKGAMVAYGSPKRAVSEGVYEIVPLSGGYFSGRLTIGGLATEGFEGKPDPCRYKGMLPGLVGGNRPPVSLDPATPRPGETTAPPLCLDARFILGQSRPFLGHQHPMSWDHDRWLWEPPAMSQGAGRYADDGGAVDSVLRAENGIVGKAQVFAMHRRVFDDGDPKHLRAGWYRPRLETPQMGELGIPGQISDPLGELYASLAGVHEGVIWSGEVEYRPAAWREAGDPTPIHTDHWSLSHHYANLGLTQYILRVGPGGDVWSTVGSMRIGSDLFGEVHRTELPLNFPMVIGHRLGAGNGWPYHWDGEDGTDPESGGLEWSPRGRAVIGPGINGVLERDHGDGAMNRSLSGVFIGLFNETYESAETSGTAQRQLSGARLEGGLALNVRYAAGERWEDQTLQDPATAWSGFVRVGDPFVEDAARIITLAAPGVSGTNPDPTSEDLARPYARHSWDLSSVLERETRFAGGAVGVVPYLLHREDCSPPLSNTSEPDNPVSYVQVPAWQWVHNWPLRNAVIGGPIDPVFGAEGVARLRLRFYGHVLDSYDGLTPDVPVRIEQWNAVTNLWEWFDPTSPEFFFDYADWSHNNVGPYWDLYLGPRCGRRVMNGSYRVTPHPATIPPEEVVPNNRLMCGQYPGLLTHEVAPFTWYIRLYNDCPDVGMAGGVPGSDGTLDNNDFIAFVSLFFQHSERADFGSAGGLPGSDGLFNNNDFIAFINLYFAGEDSNWLAQHCENVYTGCGNRPGPGGNQPEPGMAEPQTAGRQPGRMSEAGAPQQDQPGLDIFADLRAILEQRLAAESDPARAAQIQEMLNSLPQP